MSKLEHSTKPKKQRKKRQIEELDVKDKFKYSMYAYFFPALIYALIFVIGLNYLDTIGQVFVFALLLKLIFLGWRTWINRKFNISTFENKREYLRKFLRITLKSLLLATGLTIIIFNAIFGYGEIFYLENWKFTIHLGYLFVTLMLYICVEFAIDKLTTI